MTLSVDATGHFPGAVSPGSPETWAHTCAASATKLLILTAIGDSTRPSSAASYNAVDAGAQVTAGDDGNWARAEIYQVDSPASGAHTASVTNSPTQFAAYSISLIDAHSTLRSSGNATGTSANPAVNGITTVVGDIVVGVLSNDNDSVDTAQAGTLIFEDEDIGADLDASAQYVVAVGTSTNLSWTNSASGTGWAIAYAVVKQLSASGAFSLTCDSGSYALTGQSIGLLAARSLSCAQGAYALNGQVVTLTFGTSARTLLLDTGFYTVVGSAALIDLSMNADAGSYALNGQAVIFTYVPLGNFNVAANQGSYALSGQIVVLTRACTLPLVQGQYNLAGSNAGLLWSGAPISVRRGRKLGVGLTGAEVS